MKLEEVKCDKCTEAVGVNSPGRERSNDDETAQRTNNNIAAAMAKCIDCSLNMCTMCLLQKHQHTPGHQLVFIGHENTALGHQENPTEINNNSLSVKDLVFNSGNEGDSSDCFTLSTQAYMKKYEAAAAVSETPPDSAATVQVNEVTSTQNSHSGLSAPVSPASSSREDNGVHNKLSEKELEAIKFSNMLKFNQHQLKQSLLQQQEQQADKLNQLEQMKTAGAAKTRVGLIESEINKTFNFYGQVLKGNFLKTVCLC
jgi:hypothetical protein